MNSRCGAKVGFTWDDDDGDEGYVYCPDRAALEEYARAGEETVTDVCSRLCVGESDLIGVWWFETNNKVYFMLSVGIDPTTVCPLTVYNESAL